MIFSCAPMLCHLAAQALASLSLSPCMCVSLSLSLSLCVRLLFCPCYIQDAKNVLSHAVAAALSCYSSSSRITEDEKEGVDFEDLGCEWGISYFKNGLLFLLFFWVTSFFVFAFSSVRDHLLLLLSGVSLILISSRHLALTAFVFSFFFP